MDTVFIKAIFYPDTADTESEGELQNLCVPKSMLLQENGSLANLYLFLEKLFPDVAMHHDFPIFVKDDNEKSVKLESSSVLKQEIEKASDKLTVYFKGSHCTLKNKELLKKVEDQSNFLINGDTLDSTEPHGWDLVEIPDKPEQVPNIRKRFSSNDNNGDCDVEASQAKSDIPCGVPMEAKEQSDEIEEAMKQIKFETGSSCEVENMDVHEFVICDGCNDKICGYRFNCLQCSDYDLCNACFQAKKHVDANHVMLCLPKSDQRYFWQDMLTSYISTRRNAVLEVNADSSDNVSDQAIQNPFGNVSSIPSCSEQNLTPTKLDRPTDDGDFKKWLESFKSFTKHAAKILEHLGIDTMSHPDFEPSKIESQEPAESAENTSQTNQQCQCIATANVSNVGTSASVQSDASFETPPVAEPREEIVNAPQNNDSSPPELENHDPAPPEEQVNFHEDVAEDQPEPTLDDKFHAAFNQLCNMGYEVDDGMTALLEITNCDVEQALQLRSFQNGGST